jgi:hypothetical protein
MTVPTIRETDGIEDLGLKIGEIKGILNSQYSIRNINGLQKPVFAHFVA